MKIAIAADHGGYELKEVLKQHFAAYNFTDLGTNSNESVDYPDYGAALARRVAAGEFDRGILICGSGIGISIAANKVKGIRAALCHNAYTAEMSRRHNDANVIAMGGRVVDAKTAV
ncbi:MAG TPA: ribose 5-phosphate isomerase B, partial [Turneriella sp.]|nr:ribose 5-phosphate isomerase B [Turneriella sp.]